MRLIILGGPGSGKGTQLKHLSQHLNLTSIAVGDILREAIAKETFLGTKAQPFVDKGELVPDELMIQFMRLRLLKPDVNQGWVMEGYPRTAFQAEELDFVLEDFQQKLDWAIYLEVSEDVMKERSLGRSRYDDTPAILERRINRFKERTIPILAYYQPRQKLLTIDANQSPEIVARAIVEQLKIKIP